MSKLQVHSCVCACIWIIKHPNVHVALLLMGPGQLCTVICGPSLLKKQLASISSDNKNVYDANKNCVLLPFHTECEKQNDKGKYYCE